jgi:large subunit ribosomal protein L4
VRGGGRKPYRQKGTGRARQGSTRAPQFAGGGVVHGPSPRSYAQRTPKKMKAAALRGALSDRARNGRIHVVSGLVEGDVPSTKAAVTNLARLSERRHVLVVLQRSDQLAWKSLRNAESVHILVPDQLNTYDVLVSDDVVFTRAALDEFLAGPAQGRSISATATESEAATVAPVTPAADTEPTNGAPETVTASTPAKKATARKAPAKKAAAEPASAPKAAAKKTAAKKTAAPKETVVTDSENAVDEAAGSDGSDT